VAGVPISRGEANATWGSLSILMTTVGTEQDLGLPDGLNDNKIINRLISLQASDIDTKVILVTKDINMRLKARACGIEAEDYQKDQMISNLKDLTKGYVHFEGSFWDSVPSADTYTLAASVYHRIPRNGRVCAMHLNQFILDEQGFVGQIVYMSDGQVTLVDLHRDSLLNRTAWGLRARNLYQALALHLLLDTDLHLVTLVGPSGSGKTILALAAAIEMTIEQKMFNRIVDTRSTPPLAEEHGFLPGTEEEKMDP
jgi:PhoH-like ATPase